MEDGNAAPAVAAEDTPRPRLRRRVVWVAVAIVAALGLAAGVVVSTRDDGAQALDRAQVQRIAAGTVGKAIDELESKPAASAGVYQQILPSLVRIESTRTDAGGADGGLGAGVIVNADGSILTALHVVDGATAVRLSFADGTRSAATVVTTDPENDIALLRPDRSPEVIVPAVLGGAGQVGEEAYALGHPLGYQASLTTGVISGLDRSVDVGKSRLRGLIQFDAAVNPGSSGGPLLNRAGQVIGIVTALANPARDGYFVGIGFAVPIGTAGGAADTPPR